MICLAWHPSSTSAISVCSLLWFSFTFMCFLPFQSRECLKLRIVLAKTGVVPGCSKCQIVPKIVPALLVQGYCKSQWHFSAGLCYCAKRACRSYASVDLLVLPDGHIVQHLWCCNFSNCCRSVHFFQWNESEHVVLHIIIIINNFSLILAPCSLDFRGALNEHYWSFEH